MYIKYKIFKKFRKKKEGNCKLLFWHSHNQAQVEQRVFPSDERKTKSVLLLPVPPQCRKQTNEKNADVLPI